MSALVIVGSFLLFYFISPGTKDKIDLVKVYLIYELEVIMDFDETDLGMQLKDKNLFRQQCFIDGKWTDS